MNEIVAINKPYGLTPLQAINAFKYKFPSYALEKISYAGRLDPMANGLLILLVGDQNKKRNEFESLEKSYEFEILLGISTDTYDPLGLITATNPLREDTASQCIKILGSFIGQREQSYPPFSSMHVAGKPLYFWAREGKLADIKIPTKKITISSLEIASTSYLSSIDLVKKIIERVSNIKGDFRQPEIVKSWEDLTTSTQLFPIVSCRATVSSGTYIRSLAYEIGERLGVGAIAYSITRTQVGKWQLKDAIEIY